MRHTRWYDDPTIAAALAAPDDLYMEQLTARNDALFARRRSDEEHEALIVVDAEQMDAFLASYERAAYDETTETA